MIVETGAGVREADSYVSVAFVTSYLTARNRQTENSWSTRSAIIKEAAIVAATDYVDKRFGHRFIGVPAVSFTETFSKATLTFTGAPSPDDTLFLGDETYTFVSSLSGEPFEILIGANETACAEALTAAVNGSNGAGVLYGVGTPQSRHSSASASGGVVTLTATIGGAQGALTALSEALDNVTITSQFTGGVDGGIQRLCWPRNYAYDSQGQPIKGIPERLKQAVAEYAVRAVAGALLADPSIDPFAGKIQRRKEKVGPIEEEVEYDPGTMGVSIYKPYPAADRLLSPLLLGSGGVIRA